MEHKTFILTRQKLEEIDAKDYVLAGFGFGIFWYVLFTYILPIFLDFFSNAVIALLEMVIYPIGNIVPILLFGYAFVIWIAKKFTRKHG